MPFQIETHAHTREVSPCGRLAAEELVDLYHQAGYSGLVVTDHFTATVPAFRHTDWNRCVEEYLTGYRLAVKQARLLGISVYPGIEITRTADRQTDYLNDLLVYGLDETFLFAHERLYDYSLEELYRAVHEAGGLLIQAHPFREKCRCVDPDLIDGIEVFNGNPRQNSNNHLGDSYAAGHGLLRTSGSDAHQRQDVGTGGLNLESLPADSAALAAAIQSNPELLIPEGAIGGSD